MYSILFPDVAQRIPITFGNLIPIAAPPLALYAFQCYLVRRPGTRSLRLALLPLLVPWLWWLTFWVLWFPERTMAWNVPFSQCVSAVMANLISTCLFSATTGVLFVIRATEYTLAPHGRLKIGETIPGQGHLDPRRSTYRKLWDGLCDSLELCIAQRGIGWDFGTGEGLRLPTMQATRPVRDRKAWLKYTLLWDVALNYCIVDLINTWWRTIPEISSPLSAAKAFRTLTLAKQILIPGSVMVVLPCFMSLWYEIAAVFSVALLGSDPVDWPVLFGRPVSSEVSYGASY